MFFSDWSNIFRIIITAAIMYVAIIVMLRISGKKTLSSMNAFDFIITVTMGSALATVILNKSAPIIDGIILFAILILLQFIVSKLQVHSRKLMNLTNSTPSLLVYNGDFIEESMRQERITRDNIYAALRKENIGSLDEVAAVVLETDGKFSVISRKDEGDYSALKDVKMPEEIEKKLKPGKDYGRP